MFEVGKSVYFRDENFIACFGTIEKKISEDPLLVTLQVRDKYGNMHIVEKVNPSKDRIKNVEDNYLKYGYY